MQKQLHGCPLAPLQPLKEEDAKLIGRAAFGAVWDKEGGREAVAQSLASREQRKDAYTL